METDKTTKLLSETAYQLILDALFSRELPVGSKVSQKDLVRITGTAIGPIRDALKVLENDGIVKIHPRSGIEVIKPTTDLVRSTYQFRIIIEKAAARQFASNATTDAIAKMRRKHDAALAEIRSSDGIADMSDVIDTVEDFFHSGLVLSLNNELIHTSYRRLHLMARVIKLESHVSPKAAEKTLNEHLEVLDACAKRDADLAEELMSKHLLNALSRNLGF